MPLTVEKLAQLLSCGAEFPHGTSLTGNQHQTKQGSKPMISSTAVHVDTFDPEAACQQVREFHMAVLRQFILPCFLPVSLVGLVFAVVLPLFESDRVLLGLLPVLMVYVAWCVVGARRLQKSRTEAQYNLRVLKRDFPHLLRKASRVMHATGAAACASLGMFGLFAGSIAMVMFFREPPVELGRAAYLMIAMPFLFGTGIVGRKTPCACFL